jgi:hypothetical protein
MLNRSFNGVGDRSGSQGAPASAMTRAVSGSAGRGDVQAVELRLSGPAARLRAPAPEAAEGFGQDAAAVETLNAFVSDVGSHDATPVGGCRSPASACPEEH